MTFAQRKIYSSKKDPSQPVHEKHKNKGINCPNWSKIFRSNYCSYQVIIQSSKIGEYAIGISRYGNCPTSNEFSKTELYLCIITKPYFRSKLVLWHAYFKVKVQFWWKQWISSKKSLMFSYHSNPWNSLYLIYLNCLPNIYYKNWNGLEFAQIFIVRYHRFKT